MGEQLSNRLGICKTRPRIDDMNLVPAGIFRGVAGRIRQSEQGFNVFDRRARCRADADANAVVLGAPGQAIAGHRIANVFGNLACPVLRAVLQEYSKLVAAKTGRKIITPHTFPNDLPDIGEQLVPCGVTRFIIHSLEVVEIAEQQEMTVSFCGENSGDVLLQLGSIY